MANKNPGEAGGRRKVGKDKGSPTTGNGRTGGQKPNLSETNLGGGGKGEGWLARLFTRRSQPGRHQGGGSN